ncbi:Acetyltransferases, including N-acetylases of ribosomal proteins [Bordetella sputigena]|uniref:GNAT family N-acetyltransferase n=1 Tax=Bordetella sputigena TaxID=1416810 RepID=UPI0039F137B2
MEQIRDQAHAPRLAWPGPRAPSFEELLAAAAAAFARNPLAGAVTLDLGGGTPPAYLERLRLQGLLQVPPVAGTAAGPEPEPRLAAEAFYQYAPVWLGGHRPEPFPLRYTMTQGYRHPLRPPKPSGVVYRRHISWLDATLSLRVASAELDAARLNRWMNDPHVAAFWQEEGDLDKHREYLLRGAADPHTLALIACLDNVPFGYFEAYWAREDRIAPFCDARDHDRGWHVLIGEPAYRGARYVAAWLPSISHYLFLDDARTQRLVIEPRIDNARMLRNLARSGYALEKAFDFPHKRAMLGTLSRERFFAERFWIPRGPAGECIAAPAS